MAEIFEGKYINDKDISLPEMNDYYYNSLYPMTEKFRYDGNSIFYKETPIGGENALGMNAEGTVFSIKTTPKNFFLDEIDIRCGFVDGDTATFVIDNNCNVGPLQDNIDYLKKLGRTSDGEGMWESLKLKDKDLNGKFIEMRFLCLNTPEVPHWTLAILDDNSVEKKKYSEIKSGSSYSFLKYISPMYKGIFSDVPKDFDYSREHDDNDELSFYNEVEVIKVSKSINGKSTYMRFFKSESEEKTINEAFNLTSEVVDMLKSAEDIRICVATNVENKTAEKYYSDSQVSQNVAKMDLWEYIFNSYKEFDSFWFDDRWYLRAGYNIYGHELYGRALSVIYVKKDGEWINLNKYIIFKSVNTKINEPVNDGSSFQKYYNNYVPEAFAPWSYEIDKINYQDEFWNTSETIWQQDKKRREIHMDVLKKAGYHNCSNYDDLYKWTVSIGDVTFMVPPQSIRVITQTEVERTPLLRAKGSMPKNTMTSDMSLELSIFFNESKGINGIPTDLPLWTKNKTDEKGYITGETQESEDRATYYMDGLRALISQFKFTPMLPIVNEYINETLNVFAVSLENITLSTIPKFPRLLKANIILKKFDYGVYMPQIPNPSWDIEENKIRNPFSACINYDVMRYYYQKPLIRGNEIAAKLAEPNNDYTFNSIDFIRDTSFSNRTTLIPCNFVDPNINIYVANEDYLKRLLSLKKDIMKAVNSTDNFVPNDVQSKIIADFATLNARISPLINKYENKKAEFKKALKEYHEKKLKSFIYDGKDYGTLDMTCSAEHAIWVNKFIIPFEKELKAAILTEDLTTSEGLPMVKSVRKIDMLGNIAVLINPISVPTKSLIDDIIDQALVGTGLDPDDVYKNGTFILQTVSNWEFDENGVTFEKDKGSIAFLNWCQDKGLGFIDANLEAQENKEAMDWESVRSLMFDLVGENIRVDSFTAQMTNNFSRIKTQMSEGYAPQYLGGQDIRINWTITTKDSAMAGLLRGLPEYEARIFRDYHLVLPSFPIRIESEFTKFLGVFEVSIESVVVNTVPGIPGLYSIIVNAISTDRTLRNRESLRSISNTNPNDDHNGISGELSNEGGYMNGRGSRITIRTRDELSSKLAKAEVYPDLELPKIKELERLHFNFIRYRDKAREAEDIFVDPDFYFLYSYTIMAEVIKDTLQAAFNEKDGTMIHSEETVLLSDLKGEQIRIPANDKNVLSDITGWIGKQYDYLMGNENFKRDIEDTRKKAVEDKALLQDKTDVDLVKTIPAAVIGDPGRWAISKNIIGAVRENFFSGLEKLVKEDNKSVDETRKKKLKELKEFYDNRLKASDEGLVKLRNYLKNTPVEIFETDYYSNNAYEGKIYSAVEDLYNSSNLNNILHEMMAIDKQSSSNTDSIESIANMFKAVVAVETGKYEYGVKVEDVNWKGVSALYSCDPIFLMKKGAIEKKAVLENIDGLYAAGMYSIRKFTYSDLRPYLSKEEQLELDNVYNKLKEENPGKEYSFCLDPYYRLHPEEIEEYFRRVGGDPEFATVAYFRIVLWWLSKIYENNLLPNISLDVMRHHTSTSLEAQKKAEKLIKKNFDSNIYVDEELMKTIEDYLENNGYALDTGKFFMATVLALYDMPLNSSNEIWTYMMTRNYEALNSKTLSVVSYKYYNRGKTNARDIKFRKFLLALGGYKEFNGPEYIGRFDEATPASKYITNHNTKIAIEACTDPKKYLFHSFYDMVRGDYRGRMLRAFPTFYCMFIDEGRDIGIWKLHDNFYSINAISEITVTKSRKIPADTCSIVISNNYSTFVTNDEDSQMSYKGSAWGDLWEEFWDNMINTKAIYDREARKRMAQNRINKAKLSPGIRIHLRQGYGSDARELACSFNGVIAEVHPGNQMIQVIAQGNGLELTNPIVDSDDMDGDEILFKDRSGEGWNSTSGGGETPRNILKGFLTTRGTSINKYIAGEYSRNQWLFNGENDTWAEEAIRENCADNLNPFGLRSFGDPANKDTFPDGEICQNLYEISEFPNMAQPGVNLYTESIGGNEAPYISFDVHGKSIWDIMHICKSVNPDFVTGLASFGFRDTIFLGRPHYYYAYDYTKYNDTYVEKRKPFSQYHMYFSDSDIINNDITASSKYIKTNAVGLYKDVVGINTRDKQVGPIFVDKDIFPEFQKTAVVDTRLKMKDGAFWRSVASEDSYSEMPYLFRGAANLVTNIAQDIATITLGSVYSLVGWVAEDWFGTFFDGKGKWSHHEKIAWSATADALKNSMKEMYQGSLTVIGDPSVKPHDRIILYDEVLDMTGQVLVRDVVHVLSVNTGFTTTISVDCISTVDDKEEVFTQSMIAKIGCTILRAILIGLTVNLFTSSGQKKAIEYFKAVKKWGIEKAEEIFKKDKALNDFTEAGEKAGDAIKKINSESGKKVYQFIKKNGIAGGKLGMKVMKGLAHKNVITFAISTMINASIGKYLYDTIKNHQALTIYPLKKNGMTYTSGLEGSTGLIYGSPSFNDQSLFEKIVADYIAPQDEDFWLNGLRYFFIDESVLDMAAKYNKDFKYAADFGQDITVESDMEENIQSINSELMDKQQIHRGNTAFALSLFPRAIIRKKDKNEYKLIKDSLSRYYVDNLDKITSRAQTKNHILIWEYAPLKCFIKGTGILKIVHSDIDKATKNYKEIMVKTAGGDFKVCGIPVVEPGDNLVYDIPYLAKDSLVVLNDICKAASNSVAYTNELDASEVSRDNNGNQIVVKSALRPGSKYVHSASGYRFSIQGTGVFANGKLKEIVQNLYDDIKSRMEKLDKENNTPMFSIDSSNGEEFYITIAPQHPLGYRLNGDHNK